MWAMLVPEGCLQQVQKVESLPKSKFAETSCQDHSPGPKGSVQRLLPGKT